MKCFSGKVERRILHAPSKAQDYRPVALVVGHNEKNQGAENYLGETEFSFNKRVARKVQFKLAKKGITSIIFKRPVGSYKRQCQTIAQDVLDSNCVLSVHLHFNASPQKARGLEVLALNSILEEDEEVARMFAETLSNMLDIKKRHDDGVLAVNNKHNGYKMLQLVRETTDAIPILVEPCFANYRNPDSATIFEREDDYVHVLAYCIEKFMQRYDK